MNKTRSIVVLIVAAFLLSVILPVLAQDSQALQPFFVEVTPSAGAPGIYDLAVPLEVMDKSREDLADLRLYNAEGREIPYALRIRGEVDEKREVETRVFNEGRIGSTSEMALDLGEGAGEHNEVEIETSGSNFRRRVEIEGGDSGKEWRTLRTGDVIFSFEAQNKVVESKRVSYPASRYRYLRVRVDADELSDKQQPPAISGVKVMMALREKGELTAWAVPVPPYQYLRNQSSPASAWIIDLGARVPCDRLSIEVNDDSFSRPFQVEAVDDPQNIRFVTSGELTRRVGEARRPLLITFEKEVYAQRLRLLVTDFSNQTLSIASIRPGAPARQIVFELKETPVQPLRLYFGDPKSNAPHYDFEKDLQAKLSAQPVRCEVGNVTENPGYKPEPLPLTERIPWLIYAVLAASSLALAMILISLTRTTLRAKPQQAKDSNTQTSGG